MYGSAIMEKPVSTALSAVFGVPSEKSTEIAKEITTDGGQIHGLLDLIQELLQKIPDKNTRQQYVDLTEALKVYIDKIFKIITKKEIRKEIYSTFCLKRICPTIELFVSVLERKLSFMMLPGLLSLEPTSMFANLISDLKGFVTQVKNKPKETAISFANLMTTLRKNGLDEIPNISAKSIEDSLTLAKDIKGAIEKSDFGALISSLKKAQNILLATQNSILDGETIEK
jgi:hypothetical protein